MQQEVHTHLDDLTIIKLFEYAKKRFPGVQHVTYDEIIRSLLKEAGF